jgi:hypothetical protein
MLAKRIAFGFGIALIFPVLLHYGVRTFSPPPNKSEFRIENYSKLYKDASLKEKENLFNKRNKLNFELKSYKNLFNKHLFFITVPFGILAIISGVFITNNAIGTGLIFGGIFSISNGYINYWSNLPDSLKFISLLIAFIILIGVGYKKLEN